MKKDIALAILLCIFALLGAGSRTQSATESKCCTMVREALRAAADIRAGMARREVESHFRLDGGAHVRDSARYVYRGCTYIGVDIHFKLAAPANGPNESPDDVVTKVSKPYLAYPTID